ncbi:filamentous hemagglutinin N-terminal domain-containing protein [Nostoc sp. FACHB-152]|uniref:two-partner secretion domain-containing protein n=1 Tax=unclassified Nostoc TaxID=2593658 RepID=UPI0016836637|nr:MULTISPECIES: filamentous hemagglutinin N-terminal domain-containing protein [unclassified Nostoc]MBD2450319.1 filamentous hemagglutinin N-terminal domain-containing protein [Nostoc sp. FACHB-152]MBD2471777.1 filamentous hemagglutinin N-terminal domain-containing protein [Nostoc sp. FACHB-145]
MSRTNKYWQLWDWKLGIFNFLAISGAIAFWTDYALAQITPDNTLGSESSIVTPNVNINNTPSIVIDGGAQRGANLFHSFREFNIDEGRGAYFSNPDGINNIFSRVTGGSPSNILGTLGVLGNANLFMMNPNGIIFGLNASLDVGGSFVATTANALQFGNLGFFSATDKNIPSPLLTINPSALLFNQINQNAAIQNNSVAFAGQDPAGFYAFGLRVPDGKSLLLVGGDVSMDGGELSANGGRVELGGLAEPGTVALGVDGNDLSLIFPENVVRSEVSLTNQAGIYVEGAGGGNIAVNASNLEILGGSFLSGGIGVGLGTPETIGGDITLNATGSIKVVGTASSVSNLVRLNSQGNGGNITVDSGSLSLQNNSRLLSSTYGQGNAGNVTVRVRDAVDLESGDIFSTVEAGGVGKGGNIDINAATLSLKDIAQLQTLTRGASATQPGGRGDAGNVNVNVTGAIDIAGEKNGFVTGISSSVQTGTVGNGGNITINSGSFSLRDGAQLATLTSGQGNAGNVTVQARDAVSLADASILSTVEASGVGKGGNIYINAETLSLKDGAQLATITREAFAIQPAGQGDAGNVNVNVTGTIDIAGEKNGFVSAIVSFVSMGTQGNGGNITIDAASFSLRDRAQLSASTQGRGNAGNVTVRVLDAVSLVDASILSTVERGGIGKGGNIDINAATLSLTDSAQLQTLTRSASDTQPAGRGDAGNVNVNVTGAVDIAGEKNGFPSGIRSRVQTGTVGNGGNITINSDSFSLQDGAGLSAETFGQGNAGIIKVNAADFFTISGKASNFNSGLFVNSQSPTGTAGDIIVTSPRVTLDNSGRLDAESASGNGGNINLQTDLLLLRRGAQITTTAGTAQAGGNGGNINIDAPSGFIVAVPGENSDIIANAFTGIGGRVYINAFGIYGIQPRESLTNFSDITASSEFGTQGTVELNTPVLDPNSGLVNLPAVPVDTEIAQGCTAGSSIAKSEFNIVGRGGLPPNPGEALNTDAVQVDLVSLNPKVAVSSTPNSTVNAQDWIIDTNGKVTLIANVRPTAGCQN